MDGRKILKWILKNHDGGGHGITLLGSGKKQEVELL
jgi:hypothetical protein